MIKFTTVNSMSDFSGLDGSRKRKRTRSPSEQWPATYRERTDQPPSLSRTSKPLSKPAKTFTSRTDEISRETVGRDGKGSRSAFNGIGTSQSRFSTSNHPTASTSSATTIQGLQPYPGRRKYIASGMAGRSSLSQIPSRPQSSLPKAPPPQPQALNFPVYPTFPGQYVPSRSPQALDPAELGPPRTKRTSRKSRSDQNFSSPPFNPSLPLPLDTSAPRQSYESYHLPSPEPLPSASQLPPLPIQSESSNSCKLSHSSTTSSVNPTRPHDKQLEAGEAFSGGGSDVSEPSAVQSGAKEGESQRDEIRENMPEAGDRAPSDTDENRDSLPMQKKGSEIDVDQEEEEESQRKSEKELEVLWLSSDSEGEKETGHTVENGGAQVTQVGSSDPQLKSSNVRPEDLARSRQQPHKQVNKDSPRSVQQFQPLKNNAARKSAPSPQRQKRKFSSISSSRFFSSRDNLSRSSNSSSMSTIRPNKGVRKLSSTQTWNRKQLGPNAARKSAPAPAHISSSDDDDEDNNEDEAEQDEEGDGVDGDDDSSLSDSSGETAQQSQPATSSRTKSPSGPSQSSLPAAPAQSLTNTRTSTLETHPRSPSASISFRSKSTSSTHPHTALSQRHETFSEDVLDEDQEGGGTKKESSGERAPRDSPKETERRSSCREYSRSTLPEQYSEDENMGGGGGGGELSEEAETDEERDVPGPKARNSVSKLAEEAEKFLPQAYETVGTSERKLRKRSLNGGVLVPKPRAISSDISEVSTKPKKKKAQSLVKEVGKRKTWLELLKIDQQPRIEVPDDWESPPQPWLVEDSEDSLNDCIHNKQVLFKLDKLVVDANLAESILDSSDTTLTLKLESHNTIHGFPPIFTLASNVVPYIFSPEPTSDHSDNEDGPADSSTTLVPDLSHPLASRALSLRIDSKLCRNAGTISIDLLLSLKHNSTVFETRYNLCSVPSPIQPLIPRSTSEFLSFNGNGSVYGVDVTIDVVPLRKKHLSADETQLEIERRLARMSLDREGIWIPDAQAVRREGHELKEIKMIDLGRDGKYGYDFLTKLPYRTGEVVRDWHHDTPENTAHWIRIKDDEIYRSDAKAPEKLLSRAHMRWGLLNPYPPSVFDSEVTCWVHYAPLVHHFSLRSELARLLLAHHLKYNLLTEQEIREILHVYDDEKEKIEKGERMNYEQLRRQAKWSESRL
ncbi:hypothetical protein JCM3765_003377 [Sporobolomyces pararoseus]